MLMYEKSGGNDMTRIYCCITGIVLLLFLANFGPIHAAGGESVLKVGSADKLTNILRTLDWDHEGPYTAKGVCLSEDIEITRSFTLAAKDVVVPAECSKRDDCRKAVTMVIPKDMKGVKCVRIENVLGTEHCVQVDLAEKSIFRLRGKLVDTHPWTYNFIPVVELVQASVDGCQPGELQCTRDKTCWKSFNSYCRYCLERSVTTCACENEKGLLPDRTSCSFFISGDLMCLGKCRDGQCVADDERCR